VAGIDAEQKLAKFLCDQFEDDGDNEELDEAFVGAFQSFSYRMFKIFKENYVYELIEEMENLDNVEHVHVCDDCKEADLDAPLSVTAKTDTGKLH
jgi:hypothetical protein